MQYFITDIPSQMQARRSQRIPVLKISARPQQNFMQDRQDLIEVRLFGKF